MALLTTGLFENTAVLGVRPSSTVAVRISNDDSVTVTVQIEGFYLSGLAKVKYVHETLSLTTAHRVVSEALNPF